MSESSLLDLFRSRWQEIAHQFWPETPRQQLESELARLDTELGRRQSRLLYMRKRIEKIRNCLKQREHHLARLAALVQNTPADADLSAELKRQQRSVDHLRDRLQKRECGYAQRLARLRQRKHARAILRERLLSGSLAKHTDDESDPDYPF